MFKTFISSRSWAGLQLFAEQQKALFVYGELLEEQAVKVNEARGGDEDLEKNLLRLKQSLMSE